MSGFDGDHTSVFVRGIFGVLGGFLLWLAFPAPSFDLCQVVLEESKNTSLKFLLCVVLILGVLGTKMLFHHLNDILATLSLELGPYWVRALLVVWEGFMHYWLVIVVIWRSIKFTWVYHRICDGVREVFKANSGFIGWEQSRTVLSILICEPIVRANFLAKRIHSLVHYMPLICDA